MKYYHLDRERRLHEGMVIQNSKQPIVPLAQQEFDALFPNGISEWGKAVLSMQRYCSPVPKFDWNDFNPLGPIGSMMIELSYEWIRSKYFSNLPSRFASFFALQSIKDFLDWNDLIDSNQLPYSDIYEIEVDSEVLSFDSRLLQSWLVPELMDGSFPCASIITAATLKYGFLYWEGGQGCSCDAHQTQRLEYLLTPPLVIGRKVPADEIRSALHL